jgi:hypothetical protein
MSKRIAHLAKARVVRQFPSTKQLNVNIELSQPGGASSQSAGVLANAERPPDTNILEEPLQDTFYSTELSPEELSFEDETGSDKFDDDESSTDESSDDESGDDESSDDESGDDELEDGELDLELVADETEINAAINYPETVLGLEWRRGASESLKRSYGSGSKSTTKRQRRHQRELEQAASNTANIVDLFKRQRNLEIPVTRIGAHQSTRRRLEKLNCALEDLDCLIKSKKAQVRTYGPVIAPGGDFERRHRW